ncbi:MAG: hypothetical protein ACYSTL_05050 [Planctomycetota bacterium]
MSVEITVNEVFDMAIRIERDADEFYRKVALISSDPKARKVLMDLAVMEGEHELIFQGMKEELTTSAPKPDRVLSRFGATESIPVLVSVLSMGLQEDLVERFTGRESSDELLRKAIEFEKDTIVFLLAMKDMLAEAPDKAKIDAIVKEELGHIINLTGILAGTTAKK